MNVDILERVEKTTKKAPKDALLAQLDEQGKRLVQMTLDPDITYGITVDEDEQAARWLSATRVAAWPTERDHNLFWDGIEQLLKKLAPREITGGMAEANTNAILALAPTLVDLKWASRIVNKNLRAGFDIKTFNRVFGEGSVEKFTVQLAQSYEDHELRGLWFFQPKLDGNRVILLDEQAFSRNGKLYPAAQEFVNAFLAVDLKFFEKWVVDGEMMGNLGFDQSSGALRRLSEGGRKRAEFTYWVFDLVDRKEWEGRQTRSLFHRRSDCQQFFDRCEFSHIKMVPYQQLHDPTHQQVMAICDEYLKAGFEGAMAKDAQAPYKWGRGDNLLKVKKFYDADLKITGFYEGKGKHKGRLGGVYVEGEAADHNGKRFVKSEVGSGFDDALREEIWRNRDAWLGAVVQIQYQEITPKDSLRFPVFVMRRKDKE